jgi:acetoin utilization deacetylase AcuC-like enzyme
MSTGFIWREQFAWHDLGSGAGAFRAGGWIQPGEQHAEHAATKRRVFALIEASGLLDRLVRVQPRSATDEELGRFHTERYLNEIRGLAAASEGAEVGPEVYLPEGSLPIAELAAGAAIVAVDKVLAGEVDNCYVLARPPGHHAEADNGRGFCIFNNVVLAAHHARQAGGLDRVAIIDWDAHHGNGAQYSFYDDPSVLTISLHQDGGYPLDSGGIEESGEGAGLGANVNIPLPPGSGDGAYGDAIDRIVMPALRDFRPEMLLIACGYDGSGFDPMARQMLHSEAFRQMTASMMEIAAESCENRIVLTHEGGYHVGETPFCALAVLEQLSGEITEVVSPFGPVTGQELQPHQRDAVDRALAAHEGAVG